jgi:hypothetical protein
MAPRTAANEGWGIAFVEHAGKRLAVALADHNHDLALAVAVLA